MDVNPKITILMSVYNGEKYLQEAIESVLNQTFRNFEFLIINDGSTDKSEEIIKSHNDHRIRLIVNEKNIGLISSLNKGLDAARGEYIARMDCDDISLPQRLEKQFNFLKNNPDVGVVASFTREIDEDGKSLSTHWKQDRESISREEIYHNLFFGNCVAHPTVIVKKEILNKSNLRYRSDYLDAEDYDLWCRISQIAPIVKMPEPLLHYRRHSKNISISHTKEGKSRSEITAKRIRDERLKNIGISLFFLNDIFFWNFDDLKASEILYYFKGRKLITKKILLDAPVYINKVALKKYAYKKERKFFYQLFLYLFSSVTKNLLPVFTKCF